MLKLTKHLFLSDPEVKYMDYYERAVYNHILSTEEPDHGGFVYFTPMRPGHYRVYSQPQTSFWCCVGSGLENHTKYGELIYARSGDDIYVNLFIPSTLNWEEKGLRLTQETKFPDAETSTLTVNPKEQCEFTMYIRYPKWVEAGALNIQVNGQEVEVDGAPGEYVALKRTWKKGDKVQLTLPMRTTIEQLPDGESYYSILHGPIVLAAKTDTTDLVGLYADDSRGGHIASGPKYPLNEMPVVIGSADQLASMVKPVAGKAMTFTLEGVSAGRPLLLVPFFRIHETRYIIYFKVVSQKEQQAMEDQMAAEEAAKKALDEATVDLVFPGEQQPESDHFIQSENTNSGVNQGKHWRDATGWFSYQLNDKDRQAGRLRIMYFGLDNGRNFTIRINDQKLADVTLDGSKGFEFFTVDYAIPQNILDKADGKLRVKFEAGPGSVAGGIYEVRLMKK
jgi:hypothetical protein